MLEAITVAFVDALRWYLAGLFLSLPCAVLFLAFLPRTLAWGAARCLGPFLVAWVALVPAVFLDPLPFTPTTVLVAVAFLAVCGAPFYRCISLSRESWREILWLEGLWLASLAFTTTLVPWSTTISENDSILDLSYFVSVLRQQVFPLDDPALAGHRLHYYVFGFYAKGAQAFFSGLDPLQAYRAAFAATMATQIAASGMFLRALGATRVFSFVAVFVLCLCSNMESFLWFCHKLLWGGSYNTGHATGWMSDDFMGGGFLAGGLYSATLHGMVISSSFLPLFFALLAAFLMAPREDRASSDWVLAILGGWLAAIVLSTNAWELPLYLGASLACLLYTARQRSPRWTALLLLALVVTFYVAHIPLAVLAPGEELRLAFDAAPTPFWLFLRQWGTLLLPFIVGIFWRLRRWQSKSVWPALAALLAGIFTGDALWLLVAVTVFVVLEIPASSGRARTCLLLSLLGLGILGVTELTYLRNITPGRFNTLIHLNPLAWQLLAFSGAVWVWENAAQWGRPLRITTALIAGLLLFPYVFFFETKGRVVDFHSMDAHRGLGRIAQVSEDDAALIRWISAEAERRPLKGVLLEAVDPEYTLNYSSRMSSFTGVRSYLGYERHAFHEMIHAKHPDIAQRKEFLDSISAHARSPASFAGCGELVGDLRRRGIDYVAVGSLERSRFSPEVLKLWDDCLTTEKKIGSAAFYSVR